MPDPSICAPAAWGPARSEAEREEIYAFRHRHYFNELDAPGVDHAQGRVYSPHDDESAHLTVRNAAGDLLVVGTGTPASAPNLPWEWKELFRLDRLAPLGLDSIVIYSRLVELEACRGSSLFLEFFKYSARYFTERGYACAVHYCAPELAPLYERLGYRRYASGYTLPSGLHRIPMILVAADEAHLKQAHPAFLRAIAGLTPAGDVQKILAVLPELQTRAEGRPAPDPQAADIKE